MIVNHRVILASRPDGPPIDSNFSVEPVSLRTIATGEVLIQNLYVSLDAGFRNWMNEGSGDHILPAMELGAPVMGLTLGRVIESKNPAFAVSDLLMSRIAWEEYSITDGTQHWLVNLPTDIDAPHSYHLGILGDTGMSAYFGLTDIGKLIPGETLLVSGAGGAVGSVAGQVGKIYGARVVGIAGSDTKCQRLVDELGYDAAVNYRAAGNLSAAIADACPQGVDVYFDNIGGPLLQAAIDNINEKARLILCGAISDYHANEAAPGPNNLFQLVTKQATMSGLMCHYQLDRYDEARNQLMAWVNGGQLRNIEYMSTGIERVGPAFCDMFQGKNFGKTVVKLAD
ncbi:MAG: NADP-dependent oxidoreductase [Porticoccaceae bacterium]|nr:NADP-dependent oxidoreductase [Porticoccaceae bacterium]